MVDAWFLAVLLTVGQVPGTGYQEPLSERSVQDASGDQQLPLEGPVLQRLPPLPPPQEVAEDASALAAGSATWEEMTNDETALWSLNATWMSARGAEGLGLTEVSLSRTWSWCWPDERKPFQITPWVGAHFLTGLDSLNLPDAVYDVSLNMSWRVLERTHGGISVGVTPGFYGDFRTISDKTFQVTGWVTGDLQLGPRWSLVGGVAVVRQLKSSWLPVGGVIWTPTEDWQFEFMVPRPRIARRIHQTEERDVWAYMVGQFGGGSWAVDDGSGGNQLLSYSDLRFVAGLNVWRASGREFSWEIGYVFSRHLALAGDTVAVPDNTWMVQGVWVF